MPDANELTIHVFASLAQHERKVISERTTQAMPAAKTRGKVLGNPNGARALQRAGKGNAGAMADRYRGRIDTKFRESSQVSLVS